MNAYTDINKDTAAAKHGVVPDHLVAEYGPADKAPAASRFGVGTSTVPGVAEAAQARRAAKPGAYDSKR